MVIEVNIGKRIQPLEDQINMLTRQLPGLDLKRSLIFPVRRANPLQARFVVAVEGFLNEMVLQKVGLHHAWHLRWMPSLQISVSPHVYSAGHSELPSQMQIAQGGPLGPHRQGMNKTNSGPNENA